MGTTNDSVNFSKVPDDEYIAKFISEHAVENECVYAMLQITSGEFIGRRLKMVFDDELAKQMSREYAGLWISRLEFEEDERARDLEHAKSQAFHDQFFIATKGGLVESVLDPNDTWERIAECLNIPI